MFQDDPSLRIELVTQGCELSASEITDMQDDLDTLKRLIEHFPSSILHISISRHQRNKTYHVKTSLSLCGTTLFTGDRDLATHPAFERCIHKLIEKVQAHKTKMAGKIDWNKTTSGNHAELNPTDRFDAMELDWAAAQDDYATFRHAMDVFEDGLSKRIGRWVNRYPQIQEKLGKSLMISDLVEEVFLIAFDEFLQRPHDVPPGKWLEGLIDPAVQALLSSPDEEYASISYSRAILERRS